MKKSFEEVRMRITFVSKDSVLCIGELPQLERHFGKYTLTVHCILQM